MEGYKIICNEKVYVTNADNLMEAEEKFANEFPDESDSVYHATQIFDLDDLRTKEGVIFF